MSEILSLEGLEQRRQQTIAATQPPDVIPLAGLEAARQRTKQAIGWQQAQAKAKGQPWGNYALEKIPFFGSVAQGGHLAYVHAAAGNIKNGTANPQDYQIVADFIKQKENESKRTWTARVGDLVASLPGFAVEFAATAGAGSAAKAAAVKGIKSVAGEAVEKGVGRIATSVASNAAAVTAQTALQPQRIAANTIARQMPQQFDETALATGDTANIVSQQGDGTATALAKGLADTWIEVASERAGEPIVAGGKVLLGKLGKSQLGQAAQAVAARLAQRGIVLPPRIVKALEMPGVVQRMLTKGGYHGVPAEMMEERLGEVARGAVGVEEHFGATGKLFENPLEAAADMSVEAAAFAIPGMAGSAHAVATEPMRRKAIADRMASMRKDADDRAAMARQFTGPGEVGRVLGEYRASGDAARLEALAGSEAPSRDAWRKAGLPNEGPYRSQAARQEFSRTLRDILAQEREQAASNTAPQGGPLPGEPETQQPQSTTAGPQQPPGAPPAGPQPQAQPPATGPQAPQPGPQQPPPAAPPSQPFPQPTAADDRDFADFAAAHKYTIQKINGRHTGVVEGPNGFRYVPQATEREAAKREAYQWLRSQQQQTEPQEEAAPQSVLDALRQQPEIAARLPKSAGVKEGYTVEKHTQDVLDNYNNNVDKDALQATGKRYGIKDLPRLIEFAIGLHDIGKPDAVAAGDKGRQHEFTLPLLGKALAAQGFSPQEIAVASALVDNDAIGELLKGKASPARAMQQLSAQAAKAGMSPQDFFGIQTLFYKSDAGSYPALRDSLFAKKGHKLYVAQEQFSILEEMVYGKVRETPWTGRRGESGREEPRGGAGYRGASGFVHGTATKFDTPDASKDAGRNRVGPGLYLVAAEDREVADHYSRRAFNRVLSMFDGKTQAKIKAATPEQIQGYVKLAQARSQQFAATNPADAERWATAAEILQGIHDGKVGQHTLDIDYTPKRTLDLGSDDARGRFLSLADRQEILKGLSGAGAKAAANFNRGFEFYDALVKAFGSVAVNKAIRNAGFDTIHFVHKAGGYRKPYSVFVALKHDDAAVVSAKPATARPEVKLEPERPIERDPKPIETKPLRAPEQPEPKAKPAAVTVKTLSGREIPAPPRIRLDTNRKATIDLKKQNQWLIDQSSAEAQARGDNFNYRHFSNERADNLPEASKSGMSLYLFGEEFPEFDGETGERISTGKEIAEQPKVPAPFTKPLVSDDEYEPVYVDVIESPDLRRQRSKDYLAENPFKPGDRVKFDRKGETFTGTVRYAEPKTGHVHVDVPPDRIMMPLAVDVDLIKEAQSGKVVGNRGQRAIPGLEEEAEAAERAEADMIRFSKLAQELASAEVGMDDAAIRELILGLRDKVRAAMEKYPRESNELLAVEVAKQAKFRHTGSKTRDANRADDIADLLQADVLEVMKEIAPSLKKADGWEVGDGVETRYPTRFGKIDGFIIENGFIHANVKSNEDGDLRAYDLDDLMAYEEEVQEPEPEKATEPQPKPKKSLADMSDEDFINGLADHLSGQVAAPEAKEPEPKLNPQPGHMIRYRKNGGDHTDTAYVRDSLKKKSGTLTVHRKYTMHGATKFQLDFIRPSEIIEDLGPAPFPTSLAEFHQQYLGMEPQAAAEQFLDLYESLEKEQKGDLARFTRSFGIDLRGNYKRETNAAKIANHLEEIKEAPASVVKLVQAIEKHADKLREKQNPTDAEQNERFAFASAMMGMANELKLNIPTARLAGIVHFPETARPDMDEFLMEQFGQSLADFEAQIYVTPGSPPIKPDPAPKKSPLSDRSSKLPTLAEQAAEARKQFAADLDASMKAIREAGLSMNMPLNPTVAKAIAKVALSAVKAGVYTFAEFADHYRKAGADIEKIRPYLVSAWEWIKDYDNEGKLGPVTEETQEQTNDNASTDQSEPGVEDGSGQPGADAPEVSGETSTPRGPRKGPKRPRGGSLRDDSQDTEAEPADDVPGSGGVSDAGESGSDESGLAGSRAADGRGEESADEVSEPTPGLENHVIEADDDLAVRSPTESLRRNIAALELLKELEAEGRPATVDEKKILAQFSGWGGISQVLDEYRGKAMTGERGYSYGRDENWEKKWGKGYLKLKELLTPEEWTAAEDTTINAHYTSREVIQQMWKLVDRLGFKGGRVLEPGAGAGHFAGLVPDKLRHRAKFVMVERDTLSSRLLKQLYPAADVHHTAMEDFRIAPASVDLVIGNVPFAQDSHTAEAERRYGLDLNLHNYFIARSLDAVRPGGLAVVISSAHTLDSAVDQRKFLATKGQLVGAIRLPKTTFEANAKTEVVTDILVFRRPIEQENYGQPFGKTDEISVGDIQFRINEYFIANPEMVMGRHSATGTMYAKNSYTVEPKPGNLSQMIEEAIAKLPEGVYGGELAKGEIVDTKAGEDARDGTIKMVGKKLMLALGGKWVEVRSGAKPPAGFKVNLFKGAGIARAKDYIDLRDTFATLRKVMLSEDATAEQIAAAQRALGKSYANYVKQHGNLSMSGKTAIFDNDPEYYRVLSLEDVKARYDHTTKKLVYTITKAAVFTTRTLGPKLPPGRVDNVKDGLWVSLGYRGKIDVDYIATLSGKSKIEVADTLLQEGLAYRDPTNAELVTRERYLSGNVRRKLKEAELAAEADAGYQKNADDLRAIQPPRIPIENLTARLGGPWIPDVVIDSFAKRIFKTREAKVSYDPTKDSWSVKVPRGNVESTDKWGVTASDGALGSGGKKKEEGMSGAKILENTLNLKTPRIAMYVADGFTESGGVKYKEITDEKATAGAKAVAMRMQNEFAKLLRSPEGSQAAKLVEDAFNEKFNSFVDPKFNGDHLEMPGMSPEIKLRPYQKDAIWRMLQDGFAMLAHAVGAGKTYTMIGAAMEMRRLGLAKRPMLVVQNATLGQFATSFMKMYPNANVLVASKDDLAENNRQLFLNRITSGDWDAIVMAQSTFDGLSNDPEAEKQFIQDKIDEMEEAIYAAGGPRAPSVKDVVRARNDLLKKLDKLLEKEKKNRGKNRLFFEDVHVDALFLDEAHAYKKPLFLTKMENIVGLNKQASGRGISTMMKCAHVQAKSNGRNVFLATGTPITNTLGEAWHMMQFVAPHINREFGVSTFDGFAGAFAVKDTIREMNAGGQWIFKDALVKFTNGPELMHYLRSAWDILSPDDLRAYMTKAESALPQLKGGKFQSVTVDKSPGVAEFTDYLKEVYAAFKALTGKAKREFSYIPAVAYGAAKAASLDIRLIYPNAKEEKGSKLSKAAELIWDEYQQSSERKGTQLVYSDIFNPRNMSALRSFLQGEHVQAVTINDEAEDDSKGTFLYTELKKKLIAKGIPAEQIAIITDAKTDPQRESLFDRVKSGDIRVLIGSSSKMGVGVNLQDKVVAIHHLDTPWLPADYEQRNGRAIRFGNENEEVGIYNYAMKGTLDGAILNKTIRKAKFIWQVMSGKAEGREFEDPASEATLTMEEQLAAIEDDPIFFEKMDLDRQKRDLELEQESFMDSRTRARQGIEDHEWEIRRAVEKMIPHQRDLIARAEAKDTAEIKLTLDGKTYTDVKEADAALKAATEAHLAKVKKLVKDDKLPTHSRYGKSPQDGHKKSFNLNGYNMVLVAEYYAQHGADGKLQEREGVYFNAYMPGVDGQSFYDGDAKTARGIWEALQALPGRLKNALEQIIERKEAREADVKSLREVIAGEWDKHEELDRIRTRLAEIELELIQKGKDEAKAAEDRLKENKANREKKGDGDDTPLASKDTISPELREELDSRIAIFEDDSDFAADNPGATRLEMENLAIDDVVEMGEDYGGNMQHAGDRERKAWLKIWREAKRLQERRRDDRPQAYGAGGKKKGRKEPDTQARAAGDNMRVNMDAPKDSDAPPISAGDIIHTLKQLFEVPIRSGRTGMPKRVHGIYKRLAEIIRLRGKFDADLTVVAHELGHHIDKKSEVMRRIPADVEEQLKQNDYEPKKGRAFEGFAELIRQYMTGEPVPTRLDKLESWLERWMEQNPKWAEKLTRAKKLIKQYREQGSAARFQSQRQSLGSTPEVLDQKPSEWLNDGSAGLRRRLMHSMVDRFGIVRAFDALTVQKGFNPDGDATASELLSAFNMSVSSNVERALLDGVHTVSANHRLLGKGLRDFRKLIPAAEYDDWADYHTAKHVLDVAIQKPGYNTGFRLDDAQDIMEKVVHGDQERFKRFEKASRMLTQLNNDRLKMLVDAGVLTADEAQKMLDKWGATYTSLRRVKEGSVMRRIAANFLRIKKPVRGRSLEGSGLPIMDPIEATILNLMDAYDAALKQQVLMRLVRQGVPKYGGVHGMGGWIDKVPPGRKVTAGRLSEILDSLVTAGFDPNLIKEVQISHMARNGIMPGEAHLDWITTRWDLDRESTTLLKDIAAEAGQRKIPLAETAIALWRPDYSIKPDERIFRLVINGEVEMFELSPELYDGLQGMNPVQVNEMFRILVAMNRFVKLGATGISTAFAAGNLLRDYPTFLAQTKHTQGIDSWLMPLVAAAWNAPTLAGWEPNEVVKLWEEFGGKIATRLGADYQSVKNVRADVTGHGITIGEGMSRGLNKARDIIGFFEAGPRIAEFYGYLKEQGYSLKDGKIIDKDGNAARPPRGVLIGAALAARGVTTDFTRSGGIGRVVDQFIPFFNASIQSQIKGARTMGEVVTGQKNWKQRAVAIATLASGSLMYALMRVDDDDYKEQPEWLKRRYWSYGRDGQTWYRIPKPHDWGLVPNLIELAVSQMSGTERKEIRDMVFQELKSRNPLSLPAVGEIGAGLMNYNTLRGTAIEPSSLADVNPSERANETTSPAARFIGKYTGAIGVSPMKVDYILNETSGGLWDKIPLLGARDVGHSLEKWSGASAFLVNRDYSETVDDFYAAATSAKMAAETADYLGEPSEELNAEAARFEEYAKLLSAIRKPVRGEKDRAKRWEHERYVVGLARAVLGKSAIDTFENPLAMPAGMPAAVQEAMDKHFGAKVMTATLPNYERQTGQSQADYDAAKEERKNTKARGLRFLTDSGLSQEKLHSLLNRAMKRNGMKLQDEKGNAPEAVANRRYRLQRLLAEQVAAE